MFEVTFIGHQGWLFASESACVMVDPLLVEEFGHRGCVGRIFPPRRVDVASFPKVDAVILTHEHDDHFNIPSLNRLSREIPIYLSEASSLAARVILKEMGFQLFLVRAGDALRFGELQFLFFCGDHVTTDNSDEWDTLSYFAFHEHGHGNFFTPVDVKPTQLMLDIMRRTGQLPGLWCFTNNTTDWSFLQSEDLHRGRLTEPDTLSTASGIIDEFRKLCRSWAAPAGMLFCGGGFCFVGERAWLNRHVFPVDSARALGAIAALEECCFLAPLPGQCIQMMEGQVREVRASCGHIVTLAAAEWPDRRYVQRRQLIEAYEPACGRYELNDREGEELELALNEFAASLYGGPIFRGLNSLGRHSKRKATFALVLLADVDRAAFVLEYEPQSCRFIPVECEDPEGTYVAGVECWATDIYGLFTGEFGPVALSFGRLRTWNAIPDAFGFGFVQSLSKFFHPLRRPHAFLTMYRALHGQEPTDIPRVPSARNRSR